MRIQLFSDDEQVRYTRLENDSDRQVLPQHGGCREREPTLRRQCQRTGAYVMVRP